MARSWSGVGEVQADAAQRLGQPREVRLSRTCGPAQRGEHPVLGRGSRHALLTRVKAALEAIVVAFGGVRFDVAAIDPQRW